jgi:hypothetical protein
MEVKYPASIRQEDQNLLQHASSLLEEVLGPQSSSIVRTEWRSVHDHRGRTLYRLTIGDFTGEASTDFGVDELKNPPHLRVRLYRLWGDLLQTRNEQQHRQVQIISEQVAAE